MQTELTLGIVADDLTGANDTLVQFAEAGFLARLSLGAPTPHSAVPPTGHTAVATVTDARPLPDGEAAFRTRDAVEQLLRDGVTNLYVKIDSTMRGSIPGQVSGALQAWAGAHSDPFAVVCPAYPAMQRVVQGGHLLVNGKPVELSPAGTDPVTPVPTSDMLALLPDAALAQPLAELAPSERAQAILAAAEESPVVVVDVSSASDLEMLAATLQEIGPRAVPVGSAGLAGALAQRWAGSSPHAPAVHASGSSRSLVVVSSLNAVSREQAGKLVEERPASALLTLRPTLDDLRQLQTPTDAEAWLEAVLPNELPPIVMLESPARASAGDAPFPGQKSDAAQLGAVIADGLAFLTTALMGHTSFSNLILLGGDGARSVLRACDAEAVTVTGAIQEGVPLGVVNGGSADGMNVVTKAGGFGKPETLVTILETLAHHTQPTEANS